MHKMQRTVLIVEDAQTDRVRIRGALRQDENVDYQVYEAENSAQALAYVRQQQPDCLLLGWQLPDADGLTLLRTLVQATAPHIYPVVMLTDPSHIALVVQARQQGAHDFLSKAALDTEQVLYAIDNAMQKVALLRQLEEQREWFRLTLANISDGVITTDAAGCVTFMNPVAETLTGWAAGEAQAQPIGQVFRPLDETTRQPGADPVAQVLRTQQRFDPANHALLLGRGGRAIAINYSVTPVPDRLGNLSGVVLSFRDVSERKAAEQALHASEAQLNAILYNMPASIYLLTTDHRYLLVNRIFEQENHITNAEIRGQSIYDRWPLAIAEVLAANEQKALMANAPIEIEESVPRNGEMHFYASIKAPLLNEAGEPYAIIGISTDITNRKRAEEALRRSEEQLRAIINAVPGLIAYVDRDERYQFVNATYRHWFARPLDQIEGHTVQELSGTELYQQGRHRLAQVLAGQEVKTEATFTYPDGVTRTLLVNYIPHLDAAGQPQGFYVVDTDISARKQAEALLRQQADLLDQAHDAIIVWELGGGIRYWNRGSEELYGWTRNEALGQITHQLLQTRHPMAIAEFEQILRNVGEWMGEVRHVTCDGRQLVVESRYMVTHQSDGVYLVLETNRDISERQQAEAQLRQSEERYRTLFETIDEGFCVLEMIFDAQNRPYDYRFLEVNPAFARFTGLEEPVGKTARQLVPNLETYWFEIYGDVVLTGEPRRFVESSPAMGRWFEVYAFRFGGPESRRVALLFNNITDRKQAEDQLRGQEELLRQIADNVPGLIGYVGADERYRFVNATFETWFQRPRQQIIGGTVRELIGDEEHIRLTTYRQQALAGEIVSYETRFVYPDGVARTVWGRYQPHRSADGTVLGFYLFVMDISERKQAEEALQQQHTLLQNVINGTPTGIYVRDLQGRYLLANRLGAKIVGLTPEDMIGQSYQTLYPADTVASIAAEDRRILARGEIETEEFDWTPAETSYTFHSLRLPYRDPDNNIVGILNVVHDITERKRAEEQLRASEERLRLALEGGRLGIWEWQIATNTVTWTEQAYALFGLAPDTPVTYELFVSLIHGDDRAEFLAMIEQLMAQGGDFVGEFRIVRPDGQVRWLAERWIAICDAQGQPVRLLGVNFDITERKATEQALQQFNEQLEHQVKERTAELTKRLQELDQFAYVASHDLKAPLRAIDHLAQWISADAAELLPLASRDHLEKIRARIVRMEKLLDDLLAYSRADRYQYSLGKVDVALLLDDIVRLVTPPQGFAVSAQTPLPVLIAQKVPLETVLRNLINNAIKHHDRTDGQVLVTVQDLGEFLEFSVSDDGPGIAPEFHERIFQIFQTLKPRDQVEGSGMGLAIIKKLVESRNGRITLISALGQGATFRFTWPKG